MQFYCLPPSVGAASVLGIVRGCAWGGRWPLLRAGGRVGIILPTNTHQRSLKKAGIRVTTGGGIRWQALGRPYEANPWDRFGSHAWDQWDPEDPKWDPI